MWVQNLTLPLTSSVTLTKLAFVHYFTHLQQRSIKPIYYEV